MHVPDGKIVAASRASRAARTMRSAVAREGFRDTSESPPGRTPFTAASLASSVAFGSSYQMGTARAPRSRAMTYDAAM